MSMRGAVAGCMVLACLLVLLTERTEAHLPFFSPKEMMLMKEREGKKDMEPRSDDGQFEEVTTQQLLPQVESGGNTDKTVEIAVRVSAKQLDYVAPVLEEIIHEIVEDRQKAKK